ncbi:MAG: alpha/beta hydrolase [Maricaulaceae bacterium]
MPDVIFAGPAGRLEGRYHAGPGEAPPIALILHPHPKGGGTMNGRVAVALYDMFKARGFTVLRFNFRGVGRSQGTYDHGMGELADAASALDWMQSFNQNTPACWVAGHSFGAFISMQLLMRRPEISGFISVAPPMNLYDFSFLAPCPASGVVIHGGKDQVVPLDDVRRTVSKIRTQKGIVVDLDVVEEANHFFVDHLAEMETQVAAYLDPRLPDGAVSPDTEGAPNDTPDAPPPANPE